jgi:glycosyltransferase involved in cell wall biosynthesis
MFCSFVIPTIGRVSLERAVSSVIFQEFEEEDTEIIIVNDSGLELLIGNWQKSEQVTIINTYNRERNFARNSGAAIARGRYFWFLDDDDWILPGALNAFWKLSQENPDAAWLYGGLQIVSETNKILAEINSGLSGNCFAQIMGGAWAPIQTSIVSSKVFFQLGGFNPHIIGTEDLDLCRRFAYVGEFANTPEFVACLLRGESWSTSTDYNRATEDTKKSRDTILSEPSAFRRLIDSAKTPYWFGRILRIYLSTVTWNLQHQRIFTAMSRFFYSILVVLLANKFLITRQFWAGLRADHVPDTLHFVMLDYERNLIKKR